VAIAAFAVFIAPVALAQTPSPLGEWQYSAGIPLEKLYQPKPPDWEVRVGVGSTFGPRYDGSDRYRVLVGRAWTSVTAIWRLHRLARASG